MIRLLDLLGITESEISDYKVHFATGESDKLKPYKKFLIGAFKEWQERQTNKNFWRKYILSLIYYDKNKWLFGGVYEVVSPEPELIKEGDRSLWKYETRLVNRQTDLIGRIVVGYNKEFRASYPCLELTSPENRYAAPKDMSISSILDKRASIHDFAGFDNVNIDYETLANIVADGIPSWKSALSNVKGIYLIADRHTGKLYVGSAYGGDCIWQRWTAYAANGHGGNIELKELLKTNGEDYKYNFKYSILEVCNMNLGNDYIIARETHWKEVLQTRIFGLNRN